jgi:hypothetical protein
MEYLAYSNLDVIPPLFDIACMIFRNSVNQSQSCVFTLAMSHGIEALEELM